MKPWHERLLVAVICLVPVFPFFQLGVSYGLDWPNHLWLVSYYAEYLKHFWNFPLLISTNRVIGIAFPPFYANVLYEALAIPSLVLGSAIAVRVAIYLALCLQFILVRSAARAAAGEKPVTWIVATLWTWCIYPMTNIYNRSAITEFFAVIMLVCSVCCLFIVTFGPKKNLASPHGIAMGLFLALAASIHPITALVGTPYVALIALVSLFINAERKKLAAWYALSAAGFLLVMSNFIYVYRKIGNDLLIQTVHRPLTFFHDSVDWFWARFSPIPFDARVGKMNIREVSTAYLEAPLSVPLLLLVLFFGFFLWKKRKTLSRSVLALFFAACVLFVFFNWMSMSPVPWSFMPRITELIDFAYRLVTYVNISLLVAAFAALSLLKNHKEVWSNRLARPLMIFAVALNLAAVAVKIHHGTVFADAKGESETSKFRGDRDGVIELPYAFYGHGAFKTPYIYPPLYEREELLPYQIVQIRLGRGDHFDEPQPLMVEVEKEQYVRTNVLPFPWSVLYVDGKRADPVYVTDDLLTLQLSKGTHELALKEEPDPVYVKLNYLSLGMTVLWALTAAGRHLIWSHP